LRIEQIGHIIAIAEKPDWSYDKMWHDDDGPVKGLPRPGISTQAFTIEAAICCEALAGGTIISWRRYGSGFEWKAPNKNSLKQKVLTRWGLREVGKDLEAGKFFVLGLQWEPYEKQEEGSDRPRRYVKIRTFINHELDAEETLDCGRNQPSLDSGAEITIGETAYGGGEEDTKFYGSIDYVRIWKKLDVGPYAPKKAEEEKKEDEVKNEQAQ